ncbi:MAG TPA: 30S ribosomal protein S12 methylthiotransferase RimO [Syntrophorhabdaceae bacterium]|nr:30S ribosomal protein S12 methylthiotransferase RimO [Syntrophorhabdaceae bacterium]
MNYKVISLGCPKNLVESEYLVGLLSNAGHVISDQDPDAVIVNTCAFIGDSVKESIETILTEASYAHQRVIVTGCLVERYGERLKELLPEVSLFLGRNSYPEAHRLIEKEGVYAKEGMFAETFPRKMLTSPPLAYLKIQEGCDNRCTYCTIPSIRGGLRSKSIADVKREFEWLLSAGFREINIIGQDITAYGRDAASTLTQLLSALLTIKGDYYLRLMYLHPKGCNEDLIRFIKDEPKIIPYLDIPIQHSEDKILTAMGRKHLRNDLERLLEGIRRAMPDVTLRTSLIVGFPGETEEDFQNLCAFIRKWEFDMLGVFMYSKEEGTPAYKMRPQVKKTLKRERFRHVMEIQKEISKRRLSRFLGRQVKVVVEEKEGGSTIGRMLTQAPDIDGIAFIKGECAIGQIRQGKVVKTLDYDVIVEIP